MKRNKIRLIVSGLAIMGVISIVGLLIPKSKLQAPHNLTQVSDSYSYEYNIDKETIKGEVLQKLELKLATIQFSQKAKVGNDSNFLGGFFKNTKHIEYQVLAHYSIDFKNINNEQISINGDNIVLILPSPKVDVNILENSTKFTDEKGVLAFGEVELTAEEHTLLNKMVKDKITETAKTEENMGDIKDGAEKQIKELLKTVTNKSYTVDIKWI